MSGRWSRWARAWLGLKDPPGAMHFLAVADPASIAAGRCEPYRQSVRRFGYEPSIVDSWDPALGNVSKLHVYRFIAGTTWPDDDLVVLTDAHDVLMVNDPRPRLSRVLTQYRCDVLLGAEKGCAHQRGEYQEHYDRLFRDKPFKYLNSGLILGRKRHLCAVLEYLSNSRERFPVAFNSGHDQMLWGEFLVENERHRLTGIRLGLDTDARAVLTVSSQLDVPERAHAAFLHVTWLQNPSQRAKWLQVQEIFGGGSAGS